MEFITNHNTILLTAIIMLIFGTLVCIEHIKPRKANPNKAISGKQRSGMITDTYQRQIFTNPIKTFWTMCLIIANI